MKRGVVLFVTLGVLNCRLESTQTPYGLQGIAPNVTIGRGLVLVSVGGCIILVVMVGGVVGYPTLHMSS